MSQRTVVALAFTGAAVCALLPAPDPIVNPSLLFQFLILLAIVTDWVLR